MEGGEDDSTTRIYVGGLGESVTNDDLCTIFSKIGGDIKAVDIIRNKGRSFAYIDFSPSSHNSLSKLFSTYNGCVWKGKRLRLEKAKEHYLDRLKQEWAEDAQLASKTYAAAAAAAYDDADKNMDFLKKPMKELSSEKKQLRIYFPRLQKLKSLPFSGTGKHRYSFRRVEVPPLPTHFCDCEEHSGSVYTTEKKAIPVLEEQGGGMSKEELDMMNSVMNKLFEMENVSATAHSDLVLMKEQERSIKVSEDLQFEENEEYSTADDDNLIINVVQRRKATAFTDQESKLNKRQASKDGPTQDVPKRQTRRHDHSNRKGSVSAVSEGNGSFQSYLDEPGSISETELIEPQSIAKKSDPKLSWLQKSSWRELIGNKSSSAMNISDILPGISSSKEGKSKSDSIPNSKNSKSKKLSRHENQRGQTDKPEVLDKIEMEVPAETQSAKQDSDSMPNSKNKKLRQRGQTDKQEVLDKIGGPAETQPTKQDFDSIANSKNKKLLRHENQGGQTDKPEVLDKVEVEGPAETHPSKQDSDSIPKSKNNKNNKLLRHENQRGRTENQEVLDKIEEKGPAETQPTKQDSASNKTGRGSVWLNKASWTQLVASNSNSSFSIAQILPGLNFEKQGSVKPDGVIIADSTSCKHSDITEKHKSHASVDGEMGLGFERDHNIKSPPELSQLMVVGNNDFPDPTEGKNSSATKQVAPPTENIYRSAKKQFDPRTNAGGVVIGETCSFMRTDASLKEWENIKAALSGSHKRKR